MNWLAAWFLLCTENGARLTRLSSGDSRPFQAARCLNQAPLDHSFPADQLQRETADLSAWAGVPFQKGDEKGEKLMPATHCFALAQRR
jgi:hypothetical protein